MKKTIILFGIVMAMLFMGLKDVYASGSNTSDISMGIYGTIEAGNFQWEYVNETTGEKEWTISFSTSSDYIYFYLVPVGLSIDSVDIVDGTGFLLVSTGSVVGSDGSQYVLIQSANSSAETLTITVITTDTADDCQLNVSPQSLTCSTTIDGLYFDDNGNNITAAEYEELCGNTTTTETEDDPNDIPNSETGSVVPYIAIGGGLLAIIVVYFISRKSNKVYKI